MTRRCVLTSLLSVLPAVLAAIIALAVVGYVTKLNEQLAAERAELKRCREAGLTRP